MVANDDRIQFEERSVQTTIAVKSHTAEKNNIDPKQAELNLIALELMEFGEDMEKVSQIIADLKNYYTP